MCTMLDQELLDQIKEELRLFGWEKEPYKIEGIERWVSGNGADLLIPSTIGWATHYADTENRVHEALIAVALEHGWTIPDLIRVRLRMLYED